MDITAVTAFDGSYVVLSWTLPVITDTTAFYEVLRDDELLDIVNHASITSAFTDGTVVSGQDYSYEVILHYDCEEDVIIEVLVLGTPEDQTAVGEGGTALGEPL